MFFTNFNDELIKNYIVNGAVGLLPTDTIYGISCLAASEQAVKRIDEIKKRDNTKSYIVLFSNYKQLEAWGIDQNAMKIFKPFWPATLTAVLQAPKAPRHLTHQNKTIAVRMPEHPQLLNLIESVGPVISTSANISGQPVIRTAKEAKEVFGDKLDFYIEVGKLPGKASTIVSQQGSSFKIIRQGDFILK